MTDRVWINGNIITMDGALPCAEAFAADSSGRITYVGDNKTALLTAGITHWTEDALADRKPRTFEKAQGDRKVTVTDLAGCTVTPGFIENHCHLMMYGQSLLELPIRDRSKEEILSMAAEAAKSLAPGEWLVGGMGWNNEVWEDPSYPTKEELDQVCADNPVMMPRMDGHMIWVNSKALEVCGVTADTPDPEGGEFFRNEDGALQGCCANAASQLIKSFIPKPDEEARRKAYLAAQDAMLSFGITTVTDMSTSLEMVRDVKRLIGAGELKLRFYGNLRNENGGFTGENASGEEKEYFEKCPEIGLFNDHFTVRSCKFLGDGSVGAQSAHMLTDYSDRPGHKGIGMYTDEELYRNFLAAAEHGMQITIHSIGDATIDQVLRTYERVLKEVPNPDHRFRIEHFQTVTGDTPQRAYALHVIPSMQPMHAPNSASMAARRLGEERIHGAYAAGLVLKSAGIVALGSDAPVATPRVMSGIHAAVTRTNDSLQPAGGFCMENAITPEEALKGYTIWGAYTQFAENVRGSISAGKCADFVIMDRDVLKVAHDVPDELLDIRILGTYIDGECVYSCG